MILKGITLCGFKSFYRKVNLEFGSGITAIVGPNGCGKSNISDAIRWVLGEQNPRILRGKRMDDTIFKGTQSRKPLNMTEVSLSFDNSLGTAPLPYQEITITRKLFRSGESEYLINNTDCRLKDVTNLILDVGIGKDAYSLIEQKMIDEILNGKSGERRQIIEEAAGIIKYKERRKQALRRLERTRLDLEQIQVLVAEVGRTVRGLKRHVGKARRFRAFTEKVREIEVALARWEYGEFSDRKENINERSAVLEDERSASSEKVKGLEEKLQEGKTTLVSREELLGGMRESLKEKSLELKRMDERLAILKERKAHLEERGERLDVEIGEADSSQAVLKKELEVLESGMKQSSIELGELTERLNALENERDEVKTVLEDETEKYRTEERERFKRLEAISEVRAKLGALEKERNSLREKHEYLEGQYAEKRGKLEKAGGQRTGFTEEIAELKQITEKMSMRLDNLTRLKERIVQRRDTSDRSIKNNELHLNNIRAQLEMHKKWKDDYEGYPSGVVSVMRYRDQLSGILGPVGDLFEIEDRFSPAVEAGLGSYIKMIVTQDNLSALKAIDFLRSERKGVASFLPLEMVAPGGNGGPLQPPSWVIASGADVVKCDKKLIPLKDFLLGDLWIVPPSMEGKQLEEYFKTPARIVSLDGNLLRDNIVIWGGVDGDNGPLLLQRSNKIEELQHEAVVLKRTLGKVERDYQKLDLILKKADEEHSSLAQRSSGEANILKEKEIALLGLEKEETLLESEIKQIEEELRRLDLLESNREQETLDLREELAREESVVSSIEEKLPGDVLDSIRKRKDTIDKAVEEEKVEEVAVKSQLSENEKRLEWVVRELKGKEELLQRFEEEKAELEADLTKFEEEGVKLREDRGLVTSAVEELESELSGTQEEMRSARVELDQEEETLRLLRRDIDVKVAELQRLGLETNDIENRIRSLKERIEEKYRINFSELDLSEKEEDFPVTDKREELKDIKTKLNNLGHVNFVALEQYEEEEKRFTLLESQRDDLVNAKDSMERTIKKINSRAREKFTETFIRVRENFQETFRVLFQGGRADLLMNEGDDPLEAEIEMMAQPFGKRLESIELLSGGERALTALALLFAIYKVRPSPFCILDEADAALDDSNVDRLLDMLSSFSNETQFIVVTHNKKTMSSANYLYGVTMEEPGISKVVSVTLGDSVEEEKMGEKVEMKKEEKTSV
jgi:chromosome segregation protein